MSPNRMNLSPGPGGSGPIFVPVAGPLAPSRGMLRVLRGTVLAITSATLAVIAHVIGGGMPPDTGLTLLLTAGIAAGGVALADRQRGGFAILVALGVSHLAIHLLLSISSPAMSMGMSMGTGMDMSGGPAVNGQIMLAAHCVAVVLAAGLLTKAEVAIFLLAALVAMLLPRWITVLPVRLVPPPAPRAAEPADQVMLVLLRRVCSRRGPPVGC